MGQPSQKALSTGSGNAAVCSLLNHVSLFLTAL
jgi:hypothetical protein